MAKLKQVKYRVDVPVSAEINVVVEADKDADFETIMEKAVEKAIVQESKVAWMYDSESADASSGDIVKKEDE